MSRMYILNSLKNQKGITLAETAVSALLIGLIAVSIILIFTQTIDMSRRIDYEYMATNLAKSRIERARAVMQFSNFAFLPDLDETDTILDADGVPDPEGDFKRTTVVTTNYNGNTRLTKVEVTIYYKYRAKWQGGVGINMSAIFTNVE